MSKKNNFHNPQAFSILERYKKAIKNKWKGTIVCSFWLIFTLQLHLLMPRAAGRFIWENPISIALLFPRTLHPQILYFPDAQMSLFVHLLAEKKNFKVSSLPRRKSLSRCLYMKTLDLLQWLSWTCQGRGNLVMGETLRGCHWLPYDCERG